MWKERARGNLAIEFRCPTTGNFVGATRAVAIRREAIILDQISVAADERFAALRTTGVFPLTDPAGQISGIDEAQAGLTTDFHGTEKVIGRGVARVVHFVVAVKRSHMPGNVGGNARYKFSEFAQFIGGIVEAGNQQGDDLEPESHLINATNAFQDRADTAAEFVIVAIVETLEVDFV